MQLLQSDKLYQYWSCYDPAHDKKNSKIKLKNEEYDLNFNETTPDVITLSVRKIFNEFSWHSWIPRI